MATPPQHNDLFDMLRSELVRGWIEDAMREYKKHRASAGRFAEVGNHEAAMKELAEANRYKRQAAYWEAELLKAQGEE